MDKESRFRIGIIFNFTKGWLGGFYYYLNIIKALDFLEDNEKPELFIFYNKDYSEYLNEIRYPYLQLIPWNFVGVYEGYLLSILKNKNVFVEKMINEYQLNGIYPVNDNPVSAVKSFSGRTTGAAWFPDLQHRFFPQFFDKKRLWLRELRLKQTLKNSTDLVVSSFDTVEHFKQLYKIKKSLHIHVLQFVSILDNYESDNIAQIKTSYKIPEEYFIVSNAFLKHKNHMIILRALKIMKQRDLGVHVVFTGRMDIYEDGIHITKIRDFIVEEGLEGFVSLLGIIPRNHQLCLMKQAKAVVQPSLFEGWNTTIEDAKTLNLAVIASDLRVHKEQLEEKGFYFNPENAEELAALLTRFSTSEKWSPEYGDNSERARTFGRTFLNIFQKA
jgi:glycosyltransferase involved in cell wall biosynthesis